MSFKLIEQERINFERIAPWADLELIREKIITRIKENLEIDKDEHVKAFICGNKPHLPNIAHFRYDISQVYNELYTSYKNDNHFLESNSIVLRIFVFHDLWYKE